MQTLMMKQAAQVLRIAGREIRDIRLGDDHAFSSTGKSFFHFDSVFFAASFFLPGRIAFEHFFYQSRVSISALPAFWDCAAER